MTPTSSTTTRARATRFGHDFFLAFEERPAALPVVFYCPADRPVRGSAIDVLDGLLTTRRLALHPVTQEVGQDHVVPAALQAHLDDDDLELAELVRHLLQLRGLLDPAGVLPQLLTEHVAEVHQLRLGA